MGLIGRLPIRNLQSARHKLMRVSYVSYLNRSRKIVDVTYLKNRAAENSRKSCERFSDVCPKLCGRIPLVHIFFNVPNFHSFAYLLIFLFHNQSIGTCTPCIMNLNRHAPFTFVIQKERERETGVLSFAFAKSIFCRHIRIKRSCERLDFERERGTACRSLENTRGRVH